MIQASDFKTIIPDLSWEKAAPYLPLFETVLPTYQIDTPLRQAHFLAQITHESAGFKAVVENLNYSQDALYGLFRKYFPNKDLAKTYARKPEKIANRIYADRMGNSNEASGDGWKYRGRGLIQLTGKNNYTQFGIVVNKDTVGHPDQVADPELALSSACWFWKVNNLNKYADADDVVMVTKRINGGDHGLASRMHFLEEYKKLLKV